jgi:hypothetical protein
MGLDKQLVFRISRFEKAQIEKYHLDVSKICRKALYLKIREFSSDPDLVQDGGLGPAAVYVAAWNVIMPGIVSILTVEDYKNLKKSQEKLVDLQKLVAPFMKPLELENLGIFLQGGDLSKRIFESCLEQSNLESFS